MIAFIMIRQNVFQSLKMISCTADCFLTSADENPNMTQAEIKIYFIQIRRGRDIRPRKK